MEQKTNKQKLETDRLNFLEADTFVIYRPIISGISYHCYARIPISADLQKVKYRPIISVD